MEKIRVGIFGLNRGASHIQGFLANNAEIVAVCHKIPERLEKVKAKLGNHVGYYTNFDEFIEQKMDAVLLANYFHEHVPTPSAAWRGTSMFSPNVRPPVPWPNALHWFALPKNPRQNICSAKTIRS